MWFIYELIFLFYRAQKEQEKLKKQEEQRREKEEKELKQKQLKEEKEQEKLKQKQLKEQIYLQELTKQREMLYALEFEREKRRYHGVLVKAIENRKRWLNWMFCIFILLRG